MCMVSVYVCMCQDKKETQGGIHGEKECWLDAIVPYGGKDDTHLIRKLRLGDTWRLACEICGMVVVMIMDCVVGVGCCCCFCQVGCCCRRDANNEEREGERESCCFWTGLIVGNEGLVNDQSVTRQLTICFVGSRSKPFGECARSFFPTKNRTINKCPLSCDRGRVFPFSLEETRSGGLGVSRFSH